MKPSSARALRCRLALLTTLLLAPASGWSESRVGVDGAGASVRFQVIVQPYLRLLRNSHPPTLAVTGNDPIHAEQRLTVATNQANGFCLDLLPTGPGAALQSKRLSVSGAAVEVSPMGSGYRVCARRHGTFDITLNHEFQTTGALPSAVSPWPLMAALGQL